MSSRPSQFRKGGGGYLHEVDATFVGYKFEVGETSKIKQGKNKGKDFTPLNFIPEFQIDGDDEVKTKNLLIGNFSSEAYEDYEISDDGLTLSYPEGQGIFANSEAGKFLTSLIHPLDGENGFPEDRLDDDPLTSNFEPVIGTRLRLVQQPDTDPNRPKQKGKDGKEYTARDLMVYSVHDLPEAKSNGKAKAASSSKGKPSKESDFDVEAAGTEIVQAAVRAAKGRLPESKLSMAILKATMKGELKDHRDAIDAWVFENLENIEGVIYNKKKSELTLDE